jgi:hypothetical protein
MYDALLPVIVEDLPHNFVFQPGGQLRDKIRRGVEMNVVRVIAGPLKCHVVIDIQRPYYRALSDQFVPER